MPIFNAILGAHQHGWALGGAIAALLVLLLIIVSTRLLRQASRFVFWRSVAAVCLLGALLGSIADARQDMAEIDADYYDYLADAHDASPAIDSAVARAGADGRVTTAEFAEMRDLIHRTVVARDLADSRRKAIGRRTS